MNDDSTVSPSARPKRRRCWLQFGLRTLLLLITVFGVWFGFYMQRVRRQKEAVQAILDFGVRKLVSDTFWFYFGSQSPAFIAWPTHRDDAPARGISCRRKDFRR